MVSSGLGEVTSAQKDSHKIRGCPTAYGSNYCCQKLDVQYQKHDSLCRSTGVSFPQIHPLPQWSLKPMHLNSTGYWAQHATFAPWLTQAAALSNAKRYAGVEM